MTMWLSEVVIRHRLCIILSSIALIGAYATLEFMVLRPEVIISHPRAEHHRLSRTHSHADPAQCTRDVYAWFRYMDDDARVRAPGALQNFPFSILTRSSTMTVNVSLPPPLSTLPAHGIEFQFNGMWGYCSAMRRLIMTAMLASSLRLPFYVHSRGWHYDFSSSMNTFFEPFTTECPVAGQCRGRRNLKNADFFHPANYSILLASALGRDDTSVYGAMRNISFGAVWRPNSWVRSRITSLLCSNLVQLLRGDYAAFHFRRGDKLIEEARDPPPVEKYFELAYRHHIKTVFIMTDDFRTVEQSREIAQRDLNAGHGTVHHIVSLASPRQLGHSDNGHQEVDSRNATEGMLQIISEIEIARHSVLAVGDKRSNVLVLINMLHQCGDDSCLLPFSNGIVSWSPCAKCTISLVPP